MLGIEIRFNSAHYSLSSAVWWFVISGSAWNLKCVETD